jgi:hypothetical protein
MNELTYPDIQHFILIKFFFAVFIAGGLFFIFRRIKPWLFLILTGLLCAAAYYVFTDNLALSFWGLRGDEVTIAAMYNTFAHYGWFSDFGYIDLPPFYPPLWFWLFSLPGRLFSLSGIVLAKFSVFATLLFFPILGYAGQRLYWRWIGKNEDLKDTPGIIAAFLAPLLVLMLSDQDSVIGKPYEIVTAFAAVFWTIFLILEVKKESWHWTRTVIFGLAGGIIFMSYYLWLIFAAIAVSLAGLEVEKKNQLKFYGRLLAVAAIALVASLPFLGPLVYAYAKNGAENWQTVLFTPNGLAANIYIFQLLTYKNILLAAGFFTLVTFRKNSYIKPLICLLLAAYAWWLMGLATLLFFQTPIQEFKPFLFFDRVILAIALAFGLEQAWLKFQNRPGTVSWQPAVLSLGLFFLGTNLIFGSFMDDPVVQSRRVQSREMRPEVGPLIDSLRADPEASKKLILQSGITEVYAFVPINNFIYFNQHNSHPAAGFSLRREYVKIFSQAATPKDFSELTGQTPFGPIGRLILFHDQNKYFIFLHLDEFIKGVKEEVIEIPERLITAEYFNKIYDQHGFVIWDRKE